MNAAAPVLTFTLEHGIQVGDRRARGPIAALTRGANGAFLFLMAPVMDDQTRRLSGTKLMAWAMVFANLFDIFASHSLRELALTAKLPGGGEAIDWHNIALFGVAVLTWFGKLGLDTAKEFLRIWKGIPTPDARPPVVATTAPVVPPVVPASIDSAAPAPAPAAAGGAFSALMRAARSLFERVRRRFARMVPA